MMFHLWEKFTNLLLLLVNPIFFLLLAWWGSIPFVRGNGVWRFALIGLVVGVLVDLLILHKRIRNVYKIRYPVLMAVYLFYSVCIFGFFMGVPVFNLILAPLAGLYIGQRFAYEKPSPTVFPVIIRNTTLFTTAVMVLVCIASASFALLSESTPSDLEGMLSLPLTVTWGIVVLLIICGGTSLIISTYLATRWGISRGKMIQEKEMLRIGHSS